MAGRISADKKYHESIRQNLEECIHPSKHEEHPPELVNIVTGETAPSTVNEENAVQTLNDRF